jgi:hypothetical protein
MGDGALYLDLFEQPGEKGLLSKLPGARPGFGGDYHGPDYVGAVLFEEKAVAHGGEKHPDAEHAVEVEESRVQLGQAVTVYQSVLIEE